MHPSDDVHPGRQKRSHLKVRTGCATCKTRRVKCDEIHPECGRCRTANRKCIYAVPKTWLFEPKKEAVSLQPPPVASFGSPQERRAFQFFRERTAPQFAGQHELAQRFWCQHIVATAVEDPLIFKLAVAMGARHESVIRNASESSALATSCHGSAMSTLARHLTTMRVDLSLLCCSMLMGYANLCEEVPATAAIHFSLGLKILREEVIPRPRGVSDSIGAYIHPMFAELELATALFRAPSSDVRMILSDAASPLSAPVHPPAFQNLYQAKQSLANIYRWALYVTICQQSLPHGHLIESPQIDQLTARWHQLLTAYAVSVANKDVLEHHKARKMLFQYKLFVMCRGAAKTAIFNDACRVQIISVDFTQPTVTSILCTLAQSPSAEDWSPLAKRNERDRDDLDIWPQGEPAGQDGNAQIIRIILGD